MNKAILIFSLVLIGSYSQESFSDVKMCDVQPSRPNPLHKDADKLIQFLEPVQIHDKFGGCDLTIQLVDFCDETTDLYQSTEIYLNPSNQYPLEGRSIGVSSRGFLKSQHVQIHSLKKNKAKFEFRYSNEFAEKTMNTEFEIEVAKDGQLKSLKTKTWLTGVPKFLYGTTKCL